MNFSGSLYLLAALASLAVMSACKKENGCYKQSGPAETRILELPSFHTIDHSLKASFILSQGSSQQVRLNGNRTILNLIEKESYVENGIWHLGFESCVMDYDPIQVEVTLPSYVGFTNNGSGAVFSADTLQTSDTFSVVIGGSGDVSLKLNDLESVSINLAGSGNVELTGSAKQEYVSLTGTGVVDCFNLNADTASVVIQGNGNCLVRVQDHLTVEIVGNGIVYYKGYPVIIQSIQGTGSVVDAN